MVNVFETLKKYAGKWQVTDSRNLTDDEKNCIKSATVVDSEYGLSVQFVLRSGAMSYIPIGVNSELDLGDTVNLDTLKVLTLSREGDKDILKVE